jgi:hypothetical protein
MGDPLNGRHDPLALDSYDGSMSRLKVLGLAVLGIAIPFVLAFTAWNLSRPIGAPGVPPVPSLVHQQDQTGRTIPSKGGSSGGTTSTPRESSSPGVTPSPSDDHGGDRGPGDSGSSGHGSGDDSSNSGPGSSNSGSGTSGSGSGGGSGDD